MTEQELADLLGISLWLVNQYETATVPSHEKLIEWGIRLEYSREEVEWVVFGLDQALRPAPEASTSPIDPTPSEMRRVREIAGRAGRAFVALLERALVQAARTWRVRRARRLAGKLWRELDRTPPKMRQAVIEASRRFQTWSVAERIAHESALAASDQAERALELAELAYRTAELSAGDEAFVAGIKGYTLTFVANARRVANQMLRAGEDLDRALLDWGRGASEIKTILGAWRLKDLEGSLRRDQRRFLEALERLKEARQLAPPKAVPRILVNRAVVLEHMGEPEQAVSVLREAESLVGERPEPQLVLRILFNLAQNLCHMERFREAEELLPQVQGLAVAGRQELVLVRVLWLRARCDAGARRTKEARAALEQVRWDFKGRSMAYDYALVSLECAELDLREGKRAEVRALSEEMVWIFSSNGIHREALAALAMFRRAASKGRATEDLVQRVVRFLYRAQHDHKLRFEAQETGRKD